LPDLAVVVAGAGRVSFMKRAVEKLEVGLAQLTRPGLEDVRTLAEKILIQFFHDHVYPMPDYKQKESGFELILGVWTEQDGFGLFTSEDTAITPVVKHGTGHCSIGWGQYVSEYALGLTFSPGLNVETAKFVATMCVKAAKDYVDYCGGETKIFTIQNTPPHRVHSVLAEEVRDAESYSEELFSTVQAIIWLLDSEVDLEREGMGSVTSSIIDSIVDFNNRQRERRDRIRKAREARDRKALEAKDSIPPASST